MFHMQFLPLLIGGLYWKRASKLGAEVGWVVGVALGTYYTFFASGHRPSTWAARRRRGFFGLLVNAVLFIAISYFASPLPAEHRAKYESAWNGEETE